MSGIKIARDEDQLVIDWQQSKLEIPLNEAVYVALDHEHPMLDRHPALIKTPYGTRERVMIQTGANTYLLLSGDRITVLNKSHLQERV
ncbi:SunI/YnzG family protein [Paenibacillus wenxiniae]|uniref:Sublancin immunity protein SunI-like PH domain-containing protein n=1 Tax=Paenibacillus wenxiniae TaxID=1636843 RepID=A0ABW4RI92_9BACL